jgi:hypothetical protein
MKKVFILASIILGTLLSACSSSDYSISSDMTKYEEFISKVSFSENHTFFPTVEQIPETATINIKYIETLLNDYQYLEEPIVDDNDWVRIPIVEFEYSMFTVKVVDNDEFYYPMNFGMIGFSDDNHEIAFFMYFDSERDGITDINQFMETEFPENEMHN